MSGNRKKYTPEYREQAVRLVVDTSRPVAHVAAEIGVGEQLLGRWVAAAKARSATDNPPRYSGRTSGHRQTRIRCTVTLIRCRCLLYVSRLFLLHWPPRYTYHAAAERPWTITPIVPGIQTGQP